MTYIFYISNEWDTYNKKDFILKLAELKKKDRFIIINRPIDFTSFFINRSIYKVKIKEIKDKSNIRKITKNLTVLRPKILFHDLIGGKFFKAMPNKIIYKQIYNQLERYNLLPDKDEKVFIWLYSQLHWCFIDIFKNFQNKKVVWEIYDDYRLTAQGKKRKSYIDAEPNLLKRTDLIFTLTEGLKEKYKNLHDNIQVIGNGFDEKLFNQNLNNTFIEKELSKIPYPRLAYIGVIRDWIDFELLKKTILKKKSWSFIFIGPIDKSADSQMKSIENINNVYILGKKDKKIIGNYMKNVEVGIIPYINTEFTKNVKPIKLFEFLATGTPIVTSTSADISDVKGAINIYNEINLEEKISKAINEGISKKCVETAEYWSWNNLIKRNVIPYLNAI